MNIYACCNQICSDDTLKDSIGVHFRSFDPQQLVRYVVKIIYA